MQINIEGAENGYIIKKTAVTKYGKVAEKTYVAKDEHEALTTFAILITAEDKSDPHEAFANAMSKIYQAGWEAMGTPMPMPEFPVYADGFVMTLDDNGQTEEAFSVEIEMAGLKIKPENAGEEMEEYMREAVRTAEGIKLQLNLDPAGLQWFGGEEKD